MLVHMEFMSIHKFRNIDRHAPVHTSGFIHLNVDRCKRYRIFEAFKNILAYDLSPNDEIFTIFFRSVTTNPREIVEEKTSSGNKCYAKVHAQNAPQLCIKAQ